MSRYAKAIQSVVGGRSLFLGGILMERPIKFVDLQLCYSGNKKMHTFNFQTIVTPDGILSSLMGPFIGKSGDDPRYTS